MDEQEQSKPNTNLFIRGLAWEATEDDLNGAFSEYGDVKRATIPRRDDGKSKGFAFVEFGTVEEATAAKEAMDGKEIAGRAIGVDFARPRKERE